MRTKWDDEQQQWRPRFGYKRANDESAAWAIEAKEGETEDPWTRLHREKKQRVDKNRSKQLKNIRRAEGNRVSGNLSQL